MVYYGGDTNLIWSTGMINVLCKALYSWYEEKTIHKNIYLIKKKYILFVSERLHMGALLTRDAVFLKTWKYDCCFATCVDMYHWSRLLIAWIYTWARRNVMGTIRNVIWISDVTKTQLPHAWDCIYAREGSKTMEGKQFFAAVGDLWSIKYQGNCNC